MLVGDDNVRSLIESEHLPTCGMTRTAIAPDLIPTEKIVSVLAAPVAVRLNLSHSAVVLKVNQATLVNGATHKRIHVATF